MARRCARCWLLILVLAPILAMSPSAQARWTGIDRQDNRIVFTGTLIGADSEAHRHLRLKDTNGRRESYEARWSARGWRLPLLRLRLHMQALEHAFLSAGRKSLEQSIRTHPLFRGLAFTAIEVGMTDSLVGPAEYLVFDAGQYRCGTTRVYLSRRANAASDVLGDTLVTALFCPVSGEVDAARLASVLVRVGIKGIAVPEGDPVEALSGRNRDDGLADVVQTGNIKRLRRIAVRDLDPDTVISFSHPHFAGGRTLHRPMIVAVSVYGHIEMTVFLLEQGASTQGAAASAICAAIARDHPDIVRLLLETDPALADHGRCGPGGRLSALAVAERLGSAVIVELLHAAQAR